MQNKKPMTFSSGWTIRIVIIIAILVGLSLFIYYDSLVAAFHFILNRKDASHGPLVPFISLYFIWIRRKKLKEMRPDFSILPGGVIVGAGLLLFILFGDSQELTLPVLSFLIVLIGLFLCLLGRDIFKEIGFPLIFLMTLIPFPRDWYFQLGTWYREVGITSVWVLQFFDLSMYREGYLVFLPNCTLDVVHGCSGVRYILPFFVLGLAYAYLFKKTLKSRIFVVIATIPLSLLASFFRLFFIFVGVYYIGCFVAGTPHIWISWFVFIGVLAVSALFDIYICKKITQEKV